MNESTSKKNAVALAGVATVALAGGYLLRGVEAQPQAGAVVPAPAAPVVQTASTRDATAIQNAFSQVSDVIEPAVVTITTESSGPRPTSSRTPRVNPFGQGSPFGQNAPAPGGSGDDPFEEFFKQFQNKFGFEPNSLQRDDIRARFYKLQAEKGGGLGSGMIFRQDGYILTNAHVVSGADKNGITVKLADDREFKRAKLIGIDERTDVAVLKINATGLPTVKLGDSSAVRVGDWAIAVGNPFGLDHTVTVGVISAKAREVALSERNSDYLQTDASINPGNSGGPLCDINGRVIGINNAIYSQSGGNVGIGFAIPINAARDIADELVKSGKITRGYLGVTIETVDSDNASSFGIDPKTKGVLVRDITPGTPGTKAGLQPGDVIQTFNGKTVTKSNELQRLVGGAPVNSTVQLGVLRDGRTVTLSARLAELPIDTATPAKPVAPRDDEGDRNIAPGALGLKLRSLTPADERKYGVEGSRGVLVSGLVEGSPAAEAGIQTGDVIERVGQKVVTTKAELESAVRTIMNRYAADDTKRVAMQVNRKGERRWITVTSDK